jgi:hypothetical protein
VGNSGGHLDAARDEARRAGAGTRDGMTRRGMEHGAAADVAWLDAGWGHCREAAWGVWAARRATTSEARSWGFSVGRRSINGTDRGESVDESVGLVVVLERARNKAYDFFKILDVCSVALLIDLRWHYILHNT